MHLVDALISRPLPRNTPRIIRALLWAGSFPELHSTPLYICTPMLALETGLLSVSEHCSTQHPFCSVLYPKGFKAITLLQVIWAECVQSRILGLYHRFFPARNSENKMRLIVDPNTFNSCLTSPT